MRSTHEAANRTAKAHRFLIELQRTGMADSLTLSMLTESSWANIARILGENPPSAATVAEIVAIQRSRERFAAEDVDVFGLFR